MKSTLLRPGGKPASSLTDTQFIHEWADHLNHESGSVIDASRGRPSLHFGNAGLKELQDYLRHMEDLRLAPYGTDTLGEPDYRKPVADAFARDYGTPFDWQQIAFTTGGQFGLAAAFYSIFKQFPNGKVVTPSPWYLNHRELAHMALRMHGQPQRDLFLPLPLIHDDGLYINPDHVQAMIAEKPEISAFLFCNPGNPAGNVFSTADIEALTPLLKAYPDVPVMIDEAFFETAFDPKTMTDNPLVRSLKERAFVFRSGTKALGFAGERLAVMHIPEPCLEDFTYLQSRWMGNPPLSSQAVMAGIMDTLSMEDRSYIADYYQGNAKRLYEGLQALGLTCIPQPQGGFFTLMDASAMLGKKFSPLPGLVERSTDYPEGSGNDTITSDWHIALTLLAQHGIATMPASCFGLDGARGMLRVSFSISPQEIDDMLTRFERVFG